MFELLTLPFMQRALLAAVLSGLAAPAIGTYIVQRRMSLLGDGLGHVAIMGVGLSFLTGTAPLPMAIAVAILGAILVEVLRQLGRTSGDLALAVLFYGGLASGVLMAGIAGQGTAGLSAYLFGSLTSVTTTDLIVISVFAALTLVISIGLAPQFFAICVDEDYAKVLGLKTRALNFVIVILAAVTITISMRTVGLLLISALLVIPVATAQQLFVSFRAAFFGAMAIGVFDAFVGTMGSFYLDTASGATIVVTAIFVLAIAWPLGSALMRRRNYLPYVAPHPDTPHVPASHDVDVTARVIQHGDHLDYVHDGHRHAKHGDHYDEH